MGEARLRDRLPWMASQAGKWLGFVTAVWVQAISGSNYTFSNYSDALKTLMGLTQLQLNNLAVAKDAGKAFGVLAGLASDRVPSYVILLVGSIEGLVGYGAQWLVVSQTVSPVPYWQMCIFMCMGGNSSQWMNTTVLLTCLRNFRHNRGPVAGILKGYVGLSSAIFTDLCVALFNNSASAFLVMLAVIPFAVCLTAMIFLHQVPVEAEGSTEENDRWEGRYFAFFNGQALVAAFYLLLYDFLGSQTAVFSRVFTAGFLLLMATLLGAPFHVWVRSFRAIPREGLRDVETETSTALLPGEAAAEVTVEVEGSPQTGGGAGEENEVAEEDAIAAAGKKMGNRRPALGEDHSMTEVWRTEEFWLVCVTYLCGVGTGVMVMNNMGQMGLALGYTDVSIFVSLLSIFSFFGRLAGGSISEYFLRKLATARPLWSAAFQIPMIVAYVAMAMALPGCLYLGSIGVGLAYGVRQAVTVTAASELFGLKHYGLIYNLVNLSLPLGSFLFSGLIAGFLYDAEATETASGGNTCTGAHCYRLVFVIVSTVSVAGLALDLLLAVRTRALYAKIHAAGKTK